MTTATATTEKTALEVVNEAQDAISALVSVPSTILLMMESFGLDNLELTESNISDITRRHEMITDTLNLALHEIWDAIDKIENLSIKKDSGESTDTTATAK